MTGKKRAQDKEPSTARWRATFVLRCWAGEQGQVRARVIDVRTGASHPVPDIEQLAGLLRALVSRSPSCATNGIGGEPPARGPGRKSKRPVSKLQQEDIQ